MNKSLWVNHAFLFWYMILIFQFVIFGDWELVCSFYFNKKRWSMYQPPSVFILNILRLQGNGPADGIFNVKSSLVYSSKPSSPPVPLHTVPLLLKRLLSFIAMITGQPDYAEVSLHFLLLSCCLYKSLSNKDFRTIVANVLDIERSFFLQGNFYWSCLAYALLF